MENGRSRRQVAAIDYSRLDSEGLTEGVPLCDELLLAEMANTGHEDQLLQPLPDDDSVFKTDNSEVSERITTEQEDELLGDMNEARGGEPGPAGLHVQEEEVEEPDVEVDLGRDEVWQQQQDVIERNRAKRERARLRLQRERQIAEEKLREAEEREQLRRLEQEIKDINQKRRAVREQAEKEQKENLAEASRRARQSDEGTPREKKQSKARTTATQGRPVESESSDGESDNNSSSSRKKSKNKKIKSGFLDKPKSHVVRKLKWPHMNQNHRYVTASLTFNELTFNQFVGGEARTISRCTDDVELQGRLRILSKVAYLHEQCKKWEQARGVYYAVLSAIEEGDLEWDSSLAQFDLMCPPIVERHETNKTTTRSSSTVQKVQKKDFFCREFQKGECDQIPPHKLWIRNSYEQVEHFCSLCYKAKLGKLSHNPTQEVCSQRK